MYAGIIIYCGGKNGMSYGLRYKDSKRIVCYSSVYNVYACCIQVHLKRKKIGKNFEEKKNQLKYNVLPVSNVNVIKVDEDDFLFYSEKRRLYCCTRIYNNAHRVENRLLHNI